MLQDLDTCTYALPIQVNSYLVLAIISFFMERSWIAAWIIKYVVLTAILHVRPKRSFSAESATHFAGQASLLRTSRSQNMRKAPSAIVLLTLSTTAGSKMGVDVVSKTTDVCVASKITTGACVVKTLACRLILVRKASQHRRVTLRRATQDQNNASKASINKVSINRAVARLASSLIRNNKGVALLRNSVASFGRSDTAVYRSSADGQL